MTTIPPIGPPALPVPQPSSSSGTRASATDGLNKDDAQAKLARRDANEATPLNQANSGQNKEAARSQVEDAVRQIKKAVEPVARNLQFSIDEETGRTVVKIVDTSTKEVIRQIPSEELLAIAKALDRQAGEQKSGVFVQQKA